ncbi:MAG: hypothetical protein NTV63_02470 [Candidatus Woesearchaeota archaeon]|nr:hypothetical protein [Candidatus Woesearchaeota archaeon]
MQVRGGRVKKNRYEKVKLSYRITKRGLHVHINKRVYPINYPLSVWKNFSRNSKHFLSDNLLSVVGMQLPFMLNSKKVIYSSSFPMLEPFFRELSIFSAPACVDADRKSVSESLKQYLNVQHKFRNYKIKKPNIQFEPEEKSIVTFTFGKDSLMSYAICKELGLEPLPIYVKEPDLSGMYENKHKHVLQEKFRKEFGQKVINLEYGLGYARYSERFPELQPTQFGSTSQLTEYALSLLPFLKKHKASYMVFGNEKSCSDSYFTNEGFESNPVFDQSSNWMMRIKSILSIVTRNQCTAMSVVEPLHEIAITKILHNRYKNLAKYQTSCFADNDNGMNSRWCCSCSKCARMNIFMLACGIDPKSADLRSNMLGRESMPLYPIFNKFNKEKNSDDGRIKPYDMSGLGKDEQLLAFYMAYKNGAKGFLIEQFRKKFLNEAKSREDELMKKFFSVHNSITMPYKIRKSVEGIYKEELA